MELVSNHRKVTSNSKVIPAFQSSRSNYLYEVFEAVGTPNPFLLFNPSIHYWVALDNLGVDVIRALTQRANLSELKAALKRHNKIDSRSFESEVIPLLDYLVKLKFVYLNEVPPERKWGQSNFSLDDPNHYPFEDLVISLSDRCNLACSYCFNAGSRKHRLDQGKQLRRIDRQTVKKLCRDFCEKGGTGVVFSGGEPTLNPEFLGFCADAKECGLKTSLITNGTRFGVLDIDRLVTVLDALHVSIDSLDPNVNATLWGVEIRATLEDTLSALVKIGSRANELGEQIRLVLKPTITKLNLHLLKDLLLECIKRLSPFDFGLDITPFETIEDARANANLAISPSEFRTAMRDAFKAYMQTMGPDLPDAEVDYQAELFALTNAGKAAPADKPRTLSCVPSLFVTNTGDVYPCQALEVEEFKLGNVFERSIDDFFDNNNFIELRSHMTRDHVEVCKDCELRFICTEHCHGTSFNAFGRTTAFGKPDTYECREKIIKRLWLETQKKGLSS